MKARKTWPMRSVVTPPPRLPHPPAVAFATPTTCLENICVHQTWHATKEASPMPMKKRHAMKPAAFCTKAMPRMNGAVISSTNASPLRAPRMSHTMPMRKRHTMLLVTDIRLPMARSERLRPRVVAFLRTGASGAGAKVEKNVEKKPNHDAWKARMCGLLQLEITRRVALCSASTGTLKILPSRAVMRRELLPFASSVS